MNNQFFSILSRMKYITRWSLMRNSVQENISEHSLEVAFFAHALAIIAKKRFNKEVQPEKVAVVAMFHDTSEILTGDLPTPVKYYNEKLKTAYKELEKDAEEKLLSFLPEDLREEYSKIYDKNYITEYEQKLVKAGDKLSALVKCIEEEQMGNKDFLRAKETTLNSIIEMKLVEVDCFLEEFIPAFGMTLDQNMNEVK